MIFKLELPFQTCYFIIKSVDDISGKVGWAFCSIKENKSYIIKPTDEIYKYCSKDTIINVSKKTSEKDVKEYKCDKTTLYIGSYLQKTYVYTTDGILFPMEIPDYRILVEKLKPKLVLTSAGEIMNQTEAFVSTLIS